MSEKKFYVAFMKKGRGACSTKSMTLAEAQNECARLLTVPVILSAEVREEGK